MIGQESTGLNWVGAILFLVGGAGAGIGVSLLAAYLKSDRSQYWQSFRIGAWCLLPPGIIMLIILLAFLPHFSV